MDKMILEEIKAVPEFDMWYYCEVAGESRLDHDLLEELEPRWNKWQKHMKAYSLKSPKPGGGSFLLLYLESEIESEIEGIWQDSPTLGLAFHHLAITMVMSAAQSLIPELLETQCAPLPKPGQAVQEAFRELGLEWNMEGTINRQFAVFTPYPYAGGCEICFLSDTCPKSKVKKQ